jgi:hypothetical protein
LDRLRYVGYVTRQSRFVGACHAIAAFKTEYAVKKYRVGPMAGGSSLHGSIATKMCLEMKIEI